jgi:hypothetical protein
VARRERPVCVAEAGCEHHRPRRRERDVEGGLCVPVAPVLVRGAGLLRDPVQVAESSELALHEDGLVVSHS